jgi:hypothetical protein
VGDWILSLDISRFWRDLSRFGGFFVCVHVLVFVLVMGDAPSPYALILACAFAAAVAELGKDCMIKL